MTAEVRRISFAGLTLDSWLPAPPAAVWPFISEPDLLNRWSAAAVHGVERGDAGGFGTVGALRQVVLPWPLPPVTETIQHADAPMRFVYRAVGSRSIRYHRGELTLSADDGGARLRWEVGMAFAVPGAAAAVRRSLTASLTDSMGRLGEVVAGAPDADVAGERFDDDDDSGALGAARATAQALQDLAEQMRGAGDARHWFSRVYQYVTEAMIEACLRGEVAHPTWTLRLIPRFHALYTASLQGTPEPHWKAAFDAIEAAVDGDDSSALAFWQALVAGAQAHIEGDLPRVLAAIHTEHYAGRCDYERFRADFLLLAAPLGQAWQRLSAQVPARWFPPSLRLLGGLLPPEAIEHLTAKRFYDPLPARRSAFERGRALAAASAPS